MLPNQVLNAIPRQKVKFQDGTIGNVLCYCVGGIAVIDQYGKQDLWDARHCEPVPEEPRGFHVGDVVIVNGSRANPERDELEEFIKSKVDFWFRKKQFCEIMRDDFFKDELDEVAAFSARRAREKAIEEIRDFAKSYDISEGDKIHQLREQYQAGIYFAADVLGIRQQTHDMLLARHQQMLKSQPK